MFRVLLISLNRNICQCWALKQKRTALFVVTHQQKLLWYAHRQLATFGLSMVNINIFRAQLSNAIYPGGPATAFRRVGPKHCTTRKNGQFRYCIHVDSPTLFGVPLPLLFGDGDPLPKIANPSHMLPVLFDVPRPSGDQSNRCSTFFGHTCLWKRAATPIWWRQFYDGG
jgi:hypothetical protein